MPNLVRIADLSELAPGSAKVCLVQGKGLALFHASGHVYVTENACPHRGGSLGDGAVDGAHVTCPLHGWQFDLATGTCLTHGAAKVRCYAVELRGDDVWVELGSAAEPAAGQARQFLVRFGAMGIVARFETGEPVPCARGDRVVLETHRGIEVGEVLLTADASAPSWTAEPMAGRLLRAMTPEDELLERALREGQQRAFAACRELLAERGAPVELVDAEHLLDGETLIFYFLGDLPRDLADVSTQLAERYEARIEFRQFADRAAAGCGPGCGSDAGAGQCSDGSCAVGGSCKSCSK